MLGRICRCLCFTILPWRDARLSITSRSIPRGVRSEPGSIPVGTIVVSGTPWGRLRAGAPADIIFLLAIPRVILSVFLSVPAAMEEKNCLIFKRLWH
jgi:hypothetical protein